MDLTYSPAEEAFRLEARAWLRAHVPSEPLPSGDTAEGFALHRHWEKKLFDAKWSNCDSETIQETTSMFSIRLVDLP